MNLGIPVEKDDGLASQVCGHFGSAPLFMIIDTASFQYRVISNAHQRHDHGKCAPLEVLANNKIDAFVVGGIGPGALMKLMAAKIAVYRSDLRTVQSAVDAFVEGKLLPITPEETCSNHHSSKKG